MAIRKSVRPPLALPSEHSDFIDHQMNNGIFFGKRFPTHAEFQEFLQANRPYQFNERSSYECSMSCCGGGPVGEGYETDIDLNAPEWFREFQRQTASKEIWGGAELLTILRAISEKQPSKAKVK